MEGIVIDIETTGFSPKVDKIIEVAAISFKGYKIYDIFHTYIDYKDVVVPAKITEITGLNKKKIEGFPGIKEAMKALKLFVGNKQMYAYNAPFETRFLCTPDKLGRVEIMDILKVARKTERSSYKLIDVCRELNIPLNPHTAIGDALATYWLINLLGI